MFPKCLLFSLLNNFALAGFTPEEMRQRIDDLVELESDSIWVSTFHSTCARILRRHIDRIGYYTNFSIYDTDDTKKLITNLLKKNNIKFMNIKIINIK